MAAQPLPSGLKDLGFAEDVPDAMLQYLLSDGPPNLSRRDSETILSFLQEKLGRPEAAQGSGAGPSGLSVMSGAPPADK